MSQAINKPTSNVILFKHPQCPAPGKAPRRRASKPNKRKRLVAALIKESEQMEKVADFLLLTSKELRLLAQNLYEID